MFAGNQGFMTRGSWSSKGGAEKDAVKKIHEWADENREAIAEALQMELNLLAATNRLQRLSLGVGALLSALLVLDWLLAQVGSSPDLALERFLTGIAGGVGMGILTYQL